MPCQPACPVSADTWAPSAVPDVYRYADLHLPQQIGQASLAAECPGDQLQRTEPGGDDGLARGHRGFRPRLQPQQWLRTGHRRNHEIRVSGQGESLHAEVEISSRAFWNLKRQRRQLAGTSGCGLCGVEALEQALPQLPERSSQALPPAVHLGALRQRIEQAQRLARHSGALHAALYFDEHGELRLCREDIGRHNALDKLIGALHGQGLDAAQGFAVVTSRCSLELIHKAVRAGIGTLVSLSAPTALTVQWARRHQLNLIHQPHHSAPRVYSPAPAVTE